MFTARLAGMAPAFGTVWLAGTIFCAGLVAGHFLQPAASGSGPALPDPSAAPLHDPRAVTGAVYPVEVLRINDGDTFEAQVRIWPGLAVTTKVRLRNVDTAELNARCAEEYRRADAARAALQRMLDEGGVRIAQVGLDKYGGRVLADVSTRTTPDVADALLRAGHARSYSGGRKEGWCE
ncbi:MAG: thermonuclease family protein [Pseudorhodoplanes sp.]|nr:thermonuclease family protein [Pseudorhodoplanes sp.]